MTSVRVLASRALVLVMLAACGGGGQAGARRRRAVASLPANPAAVAKMVQGVQASKEPGGSPRAVGLLREAIAIDANLWESARYDLGVVLASTGDLAGAEEQLAAAAKTLAGQRRHRRRARRSAPPARREQSGRRRPRQLRARSSAGGRGAHRSTLAALRESKQVDEAIEQARREALVRKQGDANAPAPSWHSVTSRRGEKDTAQLLAKQAEDANPKSAVAHCAMALVLLGEWGRRGCRSSSF